MAMAKMVTISGTMKNGEEMSTRAASLTRTQSSRTAAKIGVRSRLNG